MAGGSLPQMAWEPKTWIAPPCAQAGGVGAQAGGLHGGGAASPPLLQKWAALALGRLVEDQPELIGQVCVKSRKSALKC